MLSIWSNSTLGLLMHWWHSNRQYAGRGTTTSRAAESLPVLDFRALSDEQLVMAEMIFDEETYEAVRRLAAKWCAEPSVHGGKARPKGARAII